MGRYGSTDPGAQSPGSSSIQVGVPLLLVADEVAADRNTFEGRDEPQVRLKWISDPDEAWVFDRISLWHIRDRQDGTASKAKQLAAALAGRIAAQVSSCWIDDETWEFGFDGAKTEVAGRFQKGMKVAAELVRRPDQQGIERLRVSRYLPVSMLASSVVNAAPIDTPEQLSPDGTFRWDPERKSWLPVAASASSPSTGGRLI